MSQKVTGRDLPVKEPREGSLQVECVKVVVSLERQGGGCLAGQVSS